MQLHILVEQGQGEGIVPLVVFAAVAAADVMLVVVMVVDVVGANALTVADG